jgi:hypothetical protein
MRHTTFALGVESVVNKGTVNTTPDFVPHARVTYCTMTHRRYHKQKEQQLTNAMQPTPFPPCAPPRGKGYHTECSSMSQTTTNYNNNKTTNNRKCNTRNSLRALEWRPLQLFKVCVTNVLPAMTVAATTPTTAQFRTLRPSSVKMPSGAHSRYRGTCW